MDKKFGTTTLSLYIENLLQREYPQSYIEYPTIEQRDLSESSSTEYVPDPDSGPYTSDIPERRDSTSSEDTDVDVMEYICRMPTTPVNTFAESLDDFYTKDEWQKEQSTLREQLASYSNLAESPHSDLFLDHPCTSQAYLESLRNEISADMQKKAEEQQGNVEGTAITNYNLGELLWRGFGHTTGQLPATIWRKLGFLEKFKVNSEATYLAFQIPRCDDIYVTDREQMQRDEKVQKDVEGMNEDTKKEFKRALEEKYQRLRIMRILKLKKKFYAGMLRSTVYELQRYKCVVKNLEKLICLQGTSETFPRKLREHLGFWSTAPKK